MILNDARQNYKWSGWRRVLATSGERKIAGMQVLDLR